MAFSPEKTLFPYIAPEQIWNEHRESTRGRDLDITGMSYGMIEAAPQQWPLRAGEASGKARLYEDGIFPTPDGHARFANTAYQPVAEPRDTRYPFSLTTGRLRDQWHGMSRTGLLPRLFGHASEPVIQMHPQDMARRLLKDGALVHVTSRHGSILVPVQPSTDVGLGQAFMAMHWGAEYLGGVSSTGQPLAGVNALTTSAYCPSAKQPELKHAAVKILKAELPWTLLAMAWLPQDRALAIREQLRGLMARFPFAVCVPFGHEHSGLLFRAAAHEPVPVNVLTEIEHLLELDAPGVLRYADRKRGQQRTARLTAGDQATLQGFLLAGDTRAGAWLKPLLQDKLPARPFGRLLLRSDAETPVPVPARGRQVCTCFNVSDLAIQAHLARSPGSGTDRLEALQHQLKCGTHCGSCLPELQRMVSAHGAGESPQGLPQTVASLPMA